MRLIRPRLEGNQATLLLLSVVSTIANTVILGIIGIVGETKGRGLIIPMTLLLGSIVCYAACKFLSARRAKIEIETALSSLRIDLVKRLLATDLASFELLGRPLLLSALFGDIQTISGAVLPLLEAIQSAMQLGGAIAYLYIVSKTAFFLAVIGVLLAARSYQRRVAAASGLFARAEQRHHIALNVLDDALRGAIQLRQSADHSDGIAAYAAAVGREAMEAARSAREAIGQTVVFGQLMTYLLIYVMVWVLPGLGLGGATVARATLVLLFILGALVNLLQGVTTVTLAEAAAAGLLDLDSRLVKPSAGQSEGQLIPPPFFKRLSFRGVSFRHASIGGQPGTVVGPLDFELKQGEIVFISGSNGAGKTTFIKLLTGLYASSAGLIHFNDRALPSDGLILRQSLAVVFSDFHLSLRLWNLSKEDLERVDALLILFELDAKVRVIENNLTTTQLSAGQRKRLALIAALLENKPVLVLDEFTADQDPTFRRRFYFDIIPELQNYGLTIIVITHDVDYFNVADRWLVMEGGRFREPPVEGPAADACNRAI